MVQLTSDSAAVAVWLREILAQNDTPDWDDDTESECDDEEGEPFERRGPRLIWYFPSNEIRDEYISNITTRPEDEVRKVIERFLIPSGAFGMDHLHFEIIVSILQKQKSGERLPDGLRQIISSEYAKRVVRYYGGLSNEPPWQGIKWVLRLLPDHPRLTLNAIEAYFTAHISSLSDGMISALGDAEAVIRARYIGVPGSTAERVQVLFELTSREFEKLVEHLYAEMGYATRLTPAIKDGGRDIIATSSISGRREHLLIECKRYRGNVGVNTVRALQGVVGAELANKGALVTTANFTCGARKIEDDDHRIELISGSQLVLLLNEYLGNTWPARMEYYTRERPFRATTGTDGYL